jgi:sodium/pantothenate symporter
VSEVTITLEERLSVAIVFTIYLASITALGLYARRVLGKTSIDRYVEEFYLAGRGFGAAIVAFIVAAGLCSVGTFVGGPGLAWSLGMPWASLMGVQIFMNFYILYGLGRKLGIVARRVGAVSLGDVLYERYDRSKLVALLYALIVVIFLIPYCSVQFVGSARVFEVMTGWPYWIALVLSGLITVFYSTIGGIRGVGLALLVQGIFMTLCYALLIAGVWGRAIAEYGSLVAINEALIRVAEESFMNAFRSPPGIAWVFSQWIIFNLGILALPHGLMAALTYKSVKAMKRAIYIGIPVVTFWTYGIWVALIGKVFFPKLPVPDHINPVLAITMVPAGLGGIVYAGVISAAQSTIATMILVMSSALLRHVYLLFVRPQATATEMKRVTLWFTLATGTLSFLLAITSPPALEYIIILAIGGTMSALFWPIIFGLFWKRANKYGAMASMVVGLLVYAVDRLRLVPISRILFAGSDPVIPGMVFSLIAFLVATYLTPPPSRRSIQLFWGLTPPEGGG